VEILMDIWGVIESSFALLVAFWIFAAFFGILAISAIIGQIYAWITGERNPVWEIMGGILEGLGEIDFGSFDFGSSDGGGCDGGGGD
jgi:hypothetical protein